MEIDCAVDLESCKKLTRYFYHPAERSDQELIEQLVQAEVVVKQVVTQLLLQHQLDALVCLVSDIVAGVATSPSASFPDSMLVVAVNRGMFHAASAEFYTFCFTDGLLNQKAWNKRRAEQYLFVEGKLMFD